MKTKRPPGRPHKYQPEPEFELDPKQEAIRGRIQKWIEENKERHIEYQREYQRKYREANREKINRQHRELHKQNSEYHEFKLQLWKTRKMCYDNVKDTPEFKRKRAILRNKYRQAHVKSKTDLYRRGENQTQSQSEELAS